MDKKDNQDKSDIQVQSYARIDLEKLSANAKSLLKNYSTGQNTSLLAVLKADAYGHGALAVAQYLQEQDSSTQISWFGVAFIHEGKMLRDAGIKKPILVFSGITHPSAFTEMLEHELTPVIFDVGHIRQLANAAIAYGVTEKTLFHLHIDTGMGRLGCRPEELPPLLDALSAYPNLQIDGVMTHFPNADVEGDASRKLETAQCELFSAALDKIDKHIKTTGRICYPSWVHINNSAAIQRHIQPTLPTDWKNTRQLLRPGISLYGYGQQKSGSNQAKQIALSPVLSWTTSIKYIKKVPKGCPLSYGGTYITDEDKTIALLPIGYADGYSVALSNKAHVIVGGRRAAVVGRVTMDLTLVDITAISTAKIGDKVIVIGEDKTTGISIFADELAKHTSTISYEILCGIGNRVLRRY